MRIIVCREKHDTCYYDASTQEALFNSAIKILQSRMGYYITDPSGPSMDEARKQYDAAKAEVDVLKETVQDINDSVVYKAAVVALRSARQNYDWYVSSKEHFERATAAIESLDGSKAWNILQERSDYEYEHVSIEKVL